jgi:hypothetical protein
MSKRNREDAAQGKFHGAAAAIFNRFVRHRNLLIGHAYRMAVIVRLYIITFLYTAPSRQAGRHLIELYAQIGP